MVISLSVVVPTYNRSESLARLLESLGDVGDDCEVIVVDDHSTDDTEDVVTASEVGRYVLNRGDGRIQARETGIKEASGDVIGFLEDDMTVENEFFVSITSAFSDFDADIVQSMVVDHHDGKSVQRVEKEPTWYQWNFEHGTNLNYCREPRDIDFCKESGLFVRREVIEDISMGDDNLIGDGYGESISFAFRAKSEGYSILYQPQAVAHHYGATTGGTVEAAGKSRTEHRGCGIFFKEFYHNMMYIHSRFYPIWALPALIYHMIKTLGRTVKWRSPACVGICFGGLLSGVKTAVKFSVETRTRSSD